MKTLLKLPAGGEQLGGSLRLTLIVAIPLMNFPVVFVLLQVTKMSATAMRLAMAHKAR
jgi:hypothetical protein